MREGCKKSADWWGLVVWTVQRITVGKTVEVKATENGHFDHASTQCGHPQASVCKVVRPVLTSVSVTIAHHTPIHKQTPSIFFSPLCFDGELLSLYKFMWCSQETSLITLFSDKIKKIRKERFLGSRQSGSSHGPSTFTSKRYRRLSPENVNKPAVQNVNKTPLWQMKRAARCYRRNAARVQ